MNRWSRRSFLARVPILALGAHGLWQAARPCPTQAAASPSPALNRVGVLKVPQGFAGECALLRVGSKTMLLMANEESDYMNQLAYDVTNPSSPILLAETAPFQFCWGVAAAGSFVAFVSSAGPTVGAYNPTTLARIWQRSLPAQAHAVATDGTNVFVAQEKTAAFLVLSGSNGSTLGTATLRDGTFDQIYATAYAAGHVYVGDPKLGVVMFNVANPSAPSYVSRFGPGASNVTANRARAWISDNTTLECWDVSSPAAPRRAGSYTVPARQTNGKVVQPVLGRPMVNEAGTELYATFKDRSDQGASGFYVFDVSENTPRPLNRFAYQFPEGRYADPEAIAVNADATVLALTSYYYGVEIWRRGAGDAWTLASAVPTAGECRDVHVDAAGNQIALGRWTVTTKSASGKVSYYTDMTFLFEGWRPYVPNTILVVDNGGWPRIYSVANGQLAKLGTIMLGAALVTDAAYDGSQYVYLCSGNTGLIAGRLSSPTGTNVSQVGTLPIRPRWVTLNGKNEAWVAGEDFGVALVDISNPAAMSVVFHDSERFTGSATGSIAVLAGRIYATCGSAGVRIYDPQRRTKTGAISSDPHSGKIFATWVEPYTSPTSHKNYLFVCHYGDGLGYSPPEGLRVYSLANPDAPELIAYYPTSGEPNFRCRIANGRLYRCALWGVEELAINGL